jgi:prevent-host-death family protein
MARYSVAQAKNNLPKLLDAALAGEEVTITRRGEVIAEIVSKRPRRSGKSEAEWFERQGLPIKPQKPMTETGAEIIRKMRDEEPGY